MGPTVAVVSEGRMLGRLCLETLGLFTLGCSFTYSVPSTEHLHDACRRRGQHRE